MGKGFSAPSAAGALLTAAALLLTVTAPANAAASDAASDASAGTSAEVEVGADRTSPVEAARVDRVPVSLRWSDCSSLMPGGTAQCATVALPEDYDRPGGPSTTVALLRVPAADPSRRIGTLFVNPGGPNGSGVLFATLAGSYLSQALRDRFDIVGFDPRGTNFGSTVRCWKNAETKLADIAALNEPLPLTREQATAAVRASAAFGRACSTTGLPLAASVSTAEVARDLDVLRRAVGDQKLSYLGFSYGSYLGNVYANMFPDRVRAVVVDGIVDPLEWVGTPATRDVPMSVRMGSGDASTKAMTELLARCRTAGSAACALAGKGDPAATYAALKQRLASTPITVPTSAGDVRVDRSVLVALLSQLLYSAYADFLVDLVASNAWDALSDDAATAAQGVGTLSALINELIAGEAADDSQRKEAARVFGSSATEYDNATDVQHAIMCTDGLNPANPSAWAAFAAASTRTAPDFGPLWTWWSGPCASSTWTAHDEDAYRGPFTRRTAFPVLVVGNYWDPATKYAAAPSVARQLPNSRLLSSDSWGHTAYGSSACVTDAVDGYLVTRALPSPGTVCAGEHQPFTSAPGTAERRARKTPPQPWFTPFLPTPPVTFPKS